MLRLGVDYLSKSFAILYVVDSSSFQFLVCSAIYLKQSRVMDVYLLLVLISNAFCSNCPVFSPVENLPVSFDMLPS